VIVLYKVVLRPGDWGDTLHDGLCLDEFRTHDRWHDLQSAAERACVQACELIGPRPRPGIQHQRPIPIAAFEVVYENAVLVARGDPTSHTEVYRVWQLADGTWTETKPEGVAS
jgi:hypothetical protein